MNLFFLAHCLLAVGCSSMYHDARSKFPPDPRARLELRMEEARGADRLLSQAGRTLGEHLQRGAATETVQADLDRVELFAFDLRRHVDAAKDAATLCSRQSSVAEELDMLLGRSNTFLAYVNFARNADPVEQASRLDEIRSQSSGPSPAR